MTNSFFKKENTQSRNCTLRCRICIPCSKLVLNSFVKKHVMRKVIVSMNVTLDGFIAGPNCELDWHFNSWTEEMAVLFCEELSRADTILLGRKTYVAMAKFWTTKVCSLSLSRDDIAFADMMNNYRKLVFSKTLDAAQWKNSGLVKGDIRQEILKLKAQTGKNIIIYGSGMLVSDLMEAKLVDEYILWVHPVALGNGKPLFRNLREKLFLQLKHIKPFDSGVVILYYQSQ